MKRMLFLIVLIAATSFAGSLEQNPVVDTVTFSSDAMAEPGAEIVILSLQRDMGLIIPTGDGRESASFEVANFEPGTYFIVISEDGKVLDSAVFTKI